MSARLGGFRSRRRIAFITPRAVACRPATAPIRCFGTWLLLLLACSAPPRAGAQTAAETPSASSAAEAEHLFRTGSAAYAAGDLKAAHTAFARLVRVAPRVAVGHSAFAAVLLAEGMTQQAVQQLEEAHRLDPADPHITSNLGQGYAASGNDSRAVASFQALPADTPLTSDEALAYAGALSRTGDLSRAQAVLTQALSVGSPSALLLDSLGVLLARDGHPQGAASRFEQAIAVDAQFAPAHAHLGSALLLTGDPARAVTELRTAEQLGDTAPVVVTQLGRALSATGDDNAAVTVLRRDLPPVAPGPSGATASLHTAPAAPANMTAADWIDRQYALAIALQGTGDSADALPLFAAVVAAQPRNTAALTNYGLAMVQTGDAKAALSVYGRALAAGARDPTLRQDMGVAYLQQNDIDHAIEEFRAAVALSPENPQLHYDLGLAYKLKDDLAAAVPELERAEALDSQLPDPPFTLGTLRMQQGQFPEAARQFERAVTLRPENGEAWALLGSVYRDSGDRPRAILALRRAIALEPDQPSPHITLAALLVQEGDTAGAASERKLAGTLTRAAVGKQKAGFALDSGRTLLREGKLAEAVAQLQTAVAAAPDESEPHLLLAQALERQGRQADALVERRNGEAAAQKRAHAAPSPVIASPQ